MLTISTRRAITKVNATRAAMPGAVGAGLAVMTDRMRGVMRTLSPRDTNRYVRGWEMAFADALRGSALGAGVSLPALRPSKYADIAREKLQDQAAHWRREAKRWEAIVAGYERDFSSGRRSNAGKTAAWYRRAVRLRNAAQRTSVRAAEELSRHTSSSIVFGLYAGTRVVTDSGRRLLTTVRANPVGGRGATIRFGGGGLLGGAARVGVMLHNLEPHSRIVESRRGVKRAMLRSARSVGAASAHRTIASAVRRAAS